MASLSFFVVIFLLFSGDASVSASGSEDMDDEELQGLFEVMGSLLEDPEWAQGHPSPCSETPWPGIKCEIGLLPPLFHVTNIHIGPDIIDPPCKPSANLSQALLKLPYLKSLSIFSCFTASPVSLFPSLFESLSYLEHLALQSNPSLSGEIPSTLGNAGSLRVLSLSQNNLKGEIPKDIGGLVCLEQLDLSYNNLSGEIPTAVGGLRSLSILDLSWNVLEGEVPSSLGQLQLLQKIDLASNKLVGRIPPYLGMLKRLVLIDFSHNVINGPIPLTFKGLENLEYLILDHNPLNSGIPSFLGTLQKLTSISLSECEIEGLIPSSLSSLKNLTALSLANNNLSGAIPSDLGQLPNLDLLNLSHNQLSGELSFPEDFITKLGKRLDVRGNEGLHSSNQLQKKNISVFPETPYCLNPTGPRNDSKNTTEHEYPEDCEKRIEPPWNHWENHWENGSSTPSLDKNLIFTLWVFTIVCQSDFFSLGSYCLLCLSLIYSLVISMVVKVGAKAYQVYAELRGGMT